MELTNFHEKVQKNIYFGPETESEAPPFTEKSNWLPPPQQLPRQIWDFFEKNCTELQTLMTNSNPPTPNLTGEEIEALETLSKREDIIIKPADKGSSIVIMDKTQYVQESLRQLQNKEFYSQLPKPIFLDSIPIIKEIVQDLVKENYINKKQANYLTGQHIPRPRRFYLLPKIHKPKEKWPTPMMPPGRPIVSDCGSESYRIAEFLDFHLNPLSSRHPSYLKDTFDFVQKVKNLEIPTDTILFTLDVDSLYTNIETPLGLQAIQEWLLKYPDEARPDKQILQLLELSLTKNDFEFKGEYFLQIKGTAMGKKFAPAYANIYMAHWEETVFPKCPKKPFSYFRYLDDIWGLWQHSEKDLEDFLTILNSHHHSIKIKSTTHPLSIDFLDTTVFKGKQFFTTHHLDTKVFFKETDTHALLHHKSYHPPHTFKGIIKSQLIRYSRICTHDEDFQTARKTLFQALRKRGYSRQQLRQIHRNYDQTNPKNRATTENQVLTPAIFTYSSTATKFTQKIKNNYQTILASIPAGEGINIIPAYRRNTNLRDLLVHSKCSVKQQRKVTKPQKQIQIVKPWRRSEAFRLANIPLNTKNCIYAITCTLCKKQYIGQTRNSIRSRWHQHKYNIKMQKGKNQCRTLIEHFQRHGLHKLHIQGVDHNPNWSTRQRLFKEHFWIKKLNTKFPDGLNERIEISS